MKQKEGRKILRKLNIYQIIDDDTKKILIEGPLCDLRNCGHNPDTITNAARRGIKYLGKYRVKVSGQYEKKEQSKKENRNKFYKLPSNSKVIAEINKKAAEQDLSYGQYQAKERKIKTTFDANLGCWKQIEIG